MKYVILSLMAVVAIGLTACASKKPCTPCNKTVVAATK
jgi:hypothetical protein